MNEYYDLRTKNYVYICKFTNGKVAKTKSHKLLQQLVQGLITFQEAESQGVIITNG